MMPAGKDNEAGLSPEIARLTQALAKDPGSRLFVPLAEEYMKAGLLEEAVRTLEEGLKLNPFYMSARVMLGRAYLGSGEKDKAREQLETVVKSVPDNLFAHRKLGEIYRSQGRRDDALRSYRMITILDPKDRDAKGAIEELEAGGGAVQEPQGPPEFKVESHMQMAVQPKAAPLAPSAHAGEAPVFDISDVEEAEPEPEAETGLEPEVEGAVIEAVEEPEGQVESEPALEPEPLLEVAEEEAEAAPEAEEKPAEPPMPKKMSYAVDVSQHGRSIEEIFAASKEEAEYEEEAESTSGVYEISEDLSGFDVEPSVQAEAKPEEKEPFQTETLAELYISQGYYDRAIGIYKSLQMERPGDLGLRQKLEDLYFLAGLSSKKAAERPKEETQGPTREEYVPIRFEEQDTIINPSENAWVKDFAAREDTGQDSILEAEAVSAIIPAEAEAPMAGEPVLEPFVVDEPPTRHKTRPPDLAAARRLGRFLENIRRKAGR